MIGDVILHFPLTDVPVTLLIVGALIDLAGLILGRERPRMVASWMLVIGTTGAALAAGTGLWLATYPIYGSHADLLPIHRLLGLATLGAGITAVALTVVARRLPALLHVRLAALLLAAVLAAATGWYGGEMAHPVLQVSGGGHQHSSSH